MGTGLWSQAEHDKFLTAIKMYPHGPWRKIAAFVGTRSIRQVQTHAQKYHEKVVRRMRGLHKGRRSSSRKEHRIDDDLLAACKVGEGFGVVLPNRIGSPPQKPPASPTSGPTELMVPLLLDSMAGSASPDRVESNGISDPVIVPVIASSSGQLPTIDESLDFLIERLSKAGNKAVEVEL
ncbi:myb domain-contaning protein [Phytophthora sojae]|uniref:Myb domain-contaning protein n=1 Tax=Phytophthora sojae (strain P6497) TaxID=1094619 RepID=G5A040_PHYSP|nr:myb domain-contaning protein [Phytophthora sojae]EGZ11283.1 myb domain-contaning protein [Phytophthora sojae]|eukprot:XP_009534028.1 myb domain-contaning protein [Phytophthora sojae]